jgi:hypothetical protein
LGAEGRRFESYLPDQKLIDERKNKNMKPEVATKFFTNTDDTGRFVVTSSRTGRTYAVEPVEANGRVDTDWGSIDPATGKLMNKKGHDKYRGAIDPKDSLITEANGFKNITMLDAGTSPLHAIEVLDAKYPDKE